MQKDYLIDIGDAVIATRDARAASAEPVVSHNGRRRIVRRVWGMLIGWIFLMPFVGSAVGAAGGAMGGAFSDVGIDDNQMKQAAQDALQPGKAGLFLLIRRMTTDKVLADLKGLGGTVIRTSFNHAKEDALKQALAGHLPPESQVPA